MSPTRRDLLAAASAAAPFTYAQRPKLTATHVVERIRNKLGIPWRTKTVDNIVLGSGDVAVTGIATTMMATLNVLERAAAAGNNFIVTHETPVYLHQDDTSDLAGDATLEYKQNFVRDHKMAVFHFHDHWHARHPDGIAIGMARELGWTSNADPQDLKRFTFEPISLEQLARQMQTRLQIRTMRVVGDSKLSIRRVMASWGFVSRMPGIEQFRDPAVDAFIAGETREWELVEYAQDSISKGDKKALILLGHVVSEQAGMKYCAEWLRSFVTDVPVDFIAAPEPFWTPRPFTP